MDGSACPGGYIEVVRKGSGTLIKDSSPWTTIGGYELKAKCTGTATKTLNITYKYEGGAEKQLFKDVPVVCPGDV